MSSNSTFNPVMSAVVSQTTANGEHTFVTDKQDFDKIFESLCDEIRTLSSRISLENESDRKIDEENIMEEQSRILYNLITLVKRFSTLSGYTQSCTQSLCDLLKSIVDEKKSCKQTVSMLQDAVDKSVEELQCYKDNLDVLKKRSSKQQDEVKNKFMDAVNKEFRACKTDLRTVLEIMYPNDSRVKDLLSELIENSPFDDEEVKWYDITESPELLPIVNVFDNACIITHEENNPNLIKLVI